MLKRKINRLWNGLASLRDYEVKDAIKKGGLILLLDDQKMTIPVSTLEKKIFQISDKKFQSKFNSAMKYTLVDIKFIPDNESQNKLF